MTTRNLALLAVLLGLLFPACAVCPQNAVKPAAAGVSKSKPATAPPAARPADKEEDERVTIEHADNFRYDAATKTYHMSGNVVFVNKDMRLYCDQADYNEEADTARATGHLRATDPNSVITGDLMEADFGKELSVVTGNVQIVTQKKGNKAKGDKPAPTQDKPKPTDKAKAEGNSVPPVAEVPAADKSKDGGEPEHMEDYWEEKTVITCERLEYYYADDVKKMIATPRVKAVQTERTVWADQAIYEDIPRLITLIGNVVLKTDKGDEMQCAKAVVWVDDDRVQAENMKAVTLRRPKNGGKAAPGAPPAGKPEPTPTAGKPEPAPATIAPAADGADKPQPKSED